MNPESPDMFFLSLGCQGVFHRENINYNGPLRAHQRLSGKVGRHFLSMRRQRLGKSPIEGDCFGMFWERKKDRFHRNLGKDAAILRVVWFKDALQQIGTWG